MLFCALELMACILLRSGEKGGAFPARMLTACLVLTGQGDRTGIHRQSFHFDTRGNRTGVHTDETSTPLEGPWTPLQHHMTLSQHSH